MREWIRRSLVNRFMFLYLLGTLIPALLVGWMAYQVAYRVVYDMSEQLMRDELQIAAVAIEEKYKNVNSMAAQITLDRELHEELRKDYSQNPVYWYFWRQEVGEKIRKILAANQEVDGCILLGDGGARVAGGSTLAWNSLTSVMDAQLRTVENTNLQFLSLPKVTWFDTNRVLLGKVVRDGSMQRSGHLFFLMDRVALLECLPEMLSESNHLFYLLDGDGNIIMTDSQLESEIDARIVGSTEPIVVVGEQSYILCGEYLAEANARLILARPMEEVLSRMMPLGLTILFTGLFIVLLAASLGAQIVRRVGHPLRRLGEDAIRFGEGNMQLNFPEEGRDEVAELGRCLNEMKVRLAKATEDRIEQTRQRIRFEMISRQNQINPHFMTNTLNDVKYMAMQHGQTDIVEMLESLGGILEVTLRSEETIPLETELRLLECYMRILRRHYEGRCAFFVRAQADALNAQVPVLALQILVENAVMHGLEEEGMLVVVVEVAKDDQGCVCLSVSDDGAGMEKEKVREILEKDPGTSHIGLANLNRRWQLIYGENCPIEIETAPGKGFRVQLRVPLKEDSACTG